MAEIRTALRKEQGGSCEIVGQVVITVKGMNNRESALKAITGLLNPVAAAAAAEMVRSNPQILTESGGAHILDTCICCDYVNNTYSWCPCTSPVCSVIGQGCPG